MHFSILLYCREPSERKNVGAISEGNSWVTLTKRAPPKRKSTMSSPRTTWSSSLAICWWPIRGYSIICIIFIVLAL